MTDARIPERYLMDRRIVRLNHAQRSSYFMSTLWSVSNRTDGHFEQDDLALIPTFDRGVVDILVNVGLWKVTETGWVDVEFLNVQTSRDDLEVLDKARAAERRKKNRQNAHKRDDHRLCTPDTCDQMTSSSPSFTPIPGEFPGEGSRGTHRRGEERRGKDKDEVLPSEESVNFAPCCGEVHGPMESCPRDQFRGTPKTSDPGYCPPPCGRTFVNGVCPKCSAKKEKTA